MRRLRQVFVVALGFALVAMVAGPVSASGGDLASPAPGGTYLTATTSLPDNFDPVGTYYTTPWALYSQLLLRTLVTYPHVSALPGVALAPDLATDTGTVSSDGLTWTFHLKSGIEFGPPVSRPITSADVEYAFERINTRSLAAAYGFYYYGVIEGMTGTASSPQRISGIDLPDASTIVFHLTHPVGDFPYRLSLGATAPVPKSIARCFRSAGGYGRDLISSGPYMIKGADRIDASSCATITPMSGFNPTSKLVLVRNPNYDPSTDTTRENYLDGVQITVDTNLADIYAKIASGTLDGSFDTYPPPAVVSKYLTDPSLTPLLHSNPQNTVDYLTMNLLVPPFNDVHVRRAANWIMNKAGIRTAQGGKVYGPLIGRIYPPSLLPGSDYDPYATTGDKGSLTKAKAEMKLSVYDSNRDGICDKPACDVSPFLVYDGGRYPAMASVVVKSLAKIGISLTVKKVAPDAFYNSIMTPSKLIPIAAFPGWIADYPDPHQFAQLFSSSLISCSYQANYSEVGMTRAQANSCGVLAAWRASPPPSVDTAIESCSALTGSARYDCWAKLEVTLMTKVVPWVPIRMANQIDIMSTNVTNYEFDQEVGMVSLCHLALMSA